MKSRTVQPAASFQPPDTCTEHEECRAGQASNADLRRAAQAHYDKISTAAHEWHSAIPKAIDAYYKDAERSRLEREVIEAAKEEYKIEYEADHGDNTITRTDALITMQPAIQKRREAVAALIDFESKQETKVK